MSYQAEISQENPSAFLFLVDQSWSMHEMLPAVGQKPAMSKAAAVAEAINLLITEIAIHCSKGEAINDYFTLALIGYGGTAHSAWGGDLSGRLAVPISEVDAHPLRYERKDTPMDDDAGGVITRSIEYPV